MHQRNWSAPAELRDWRAAPAVRGLYVLGEKLNPSAAFGPPIDGGGKLGGFPDNFVPRYIGNSLCATRGIRARLYSHATRRGNERVAKAIEQGRQLYFVFIEGSDSAEFEAIYLHLPTGIRFDFNRRSELARYLRRLGARLPSQGPVGPQPWNSAVDRPPLFPGIFDANTVY